MLNPHTYTRRRQIAQGIHLNRNCICVDDESMIAGDKNNEKIENVYKQFASCFIAFQVIFVCAREEDRHTQRAQRGRNIVM